MAAPSSFDQVKEWFSSYTLSQKVAIVGSAAGSVVLLWALVYFVNQVDYQVLYSELEPTEAQGIVQRLQGMSIPYEISSDGTTVRVAQDNLSEVRIQLASEGLPASGRIGFEIFDRTNFGLTNFQEQVNFQRALEGELARSIATLSEVDAVRIHLVLPSESLFKSPADQTKASVILSLKQGRALEAAAVTGILHLLASSVKGLDPSKVTVIDYAGRMLSRNDDAAPMSSRQLDTRLTVESDLAGKITQILEPVVAWARCGHRYQSSWTGSKSKKPLKNTIPLLRSCVPNSGERSDPRARVKARPSECPGPRAGRLTPLLRFPRPLGLGTSSAKTRP